LSDSEPEYMAELIYQDTTDNWVLRVIARPEPEELDPLSMRPVRAQRPMFDPLTVFQSDSGPAKVAAERPLSQYGWAPAMGFYGWEWDGDDSCWWEDVVRKGK
jgi:hypothetical protein